MPALKSIRDKFDQNLYSAMLLYEVAQKFSPPPPDAPNARPPVSRGQARRVAGLAFLVMVRAWEELVESCLVRYLAGASAPSGYQPALNTAKARTIAAAYQTATARNGGLGGNGSYLSVSDWGRVTEFARRHFNEGQPFTSLNDAQRQKFANAIKIRNRVAHSSKKCRTEFLAVVTSHEMPNEERPRGYTVGHLLLKVGNHGFGKQARQQTFFLHYRALFHAMANQICPTSKEAPQRAGESHD